MRIAMIIVIFLFIGAFFIISQNGLSMLEKENTVKFLSLYKSWIGSTVGNVGSLTGHIVKLEWLPS